MLSVEHEGLARVAPAMQRTGPPPVSAHSFALAQWGGVIAMVGVYLCVFGTLLLQNDFFPYVFDNNESFSSFFHALNLKTYGWGQSYGLVDESYGFHAAAHPYVYTHGGDFPRFWALLVMWLGGTSIESQIVVSTLVVGLASVLLAYRFLSLITSRLLAVMFCLCLMTDYVMFVQWNVVTFRVWYGFTFFSTLLCAHGFAKGRLAFWGPLTLINYLVLFNVELVFAAFVAAIAVLYSTYLLARSPRRLLTAYLFQTLGFGAALGVLVSQTVAYMGWDAFWQDIELTFLARNWGGSEALVQEIDAFLEAHPLVFWYNIVDQADLRTVGRFLASQLRFVLQVYTPAFTLFVGVIFSGWLLDRLLSQILAARTPLNGTGGWRAAVDPGLGWLRRPAGPGLMKNGILPTFIAFALAVLADEAFAGIHGTQGSLRVYMLELMVAAAILWIVVLSLARSIQRALLRADAPSRGRVIAVSSMLACLALWVRFQPALYNSYFEPLWVETMSLWPTLLIPQLAILGAAAYALQLVLRGSGVGAGGELRLALGRVLPYLTCALLGYCMIYLLSPGYLHSGYLHRHAPFTVFFHLVPYAVVFCLLAALVADASSRLALARRLAQEISDKGRVHRRRSAIWSAASGLAGALALFTFAVIQWIGVQQTYWRLLPADHYAYLNHLEESPYRGASFVANNYAAPVASYTRQWAYQDPEFAKGEITLTDQGFEVKRDLRYLWLADRRENPDYLTPDYFICMKPQQLESAIVHLGEDEDRAGCSSLPIFQQAELGSSVLQHRVVARDESGRDRWAIIKLDWDYPPFLRRLDSATESPRVALEVQQSRESLVLRVDYEYAQQQGKAERDSEVFLYRIRGGPCERPSADHRIVQAADRVEFRLPVEFRGVVRAGVTPRSGTKAGPEFFSAPIVLSAKRPPEPIRCN